MKFLELVCMLDDLLRILDLLNVEQRVDELYLSELYASMLMERFLVASEGIV
jgi:hypothetical protein